MDDIPQDVLHEAHEAGHYDSPYAFLRVVAGHFADRAERLRALRKKGWQTANRELDGVADHIRAYAEQLETFAANNPSGFSIVDDPCGALHPHTKSECVHPSGHDGDHGNLTDGDWASSNQLADWEERVVAKLAKGKARKETPQLPGNTGRCASFRRADADDPVICVQIRGHGGDHMSDASHHGPHVWPRRTSHHVCEYVTVTDLESGLSGDVCNLPGPHGGSAKDQAAGAPTQVCGDVVVLPDGTALNCALPFGHGGAEHHDGRYHLWPRGEGTRRPVTVCGLCNTDGHACGGCGEITGHDGAHACDHPDSSWYVAPPAPPAEPGTVPPCGDLQPDVATALGTSCMLPKGHTGKHIGYTGARWDRTVATEAHGLAVTHVAGSTATVYPMPGGMAVVEVTQTMDSGTALHTLGDIAEQQRATMVIPEQRPASDPVPVPAAVLVAEMKEEVSATVAELTGDEPIGTVVNVGGIEFVKHSSNPFVLAVNDSGPVLAQTLGNPFAPRVIAEFALPASADGGLSTVLGNPFQAPTPPPAAFLPPHLVPGEPKAHQSHSSITTMEKCGLQYRLKYRDQIGDDTPAWWNVAGTAFHTIVQAIEAAHAGAAPNDIASMWHPAAPLMAQEREAAAMWKEQFSILVDQTERESGKARSTWKAAKGGKEGEAFWREYGGDLARSYVAHRRRFLAEPEGWRLLTKPGGEGWAHEVEFNANVDGVLLNGFIDAAWISADGNTILIEDFKSGSSEGDPFQPKLYGAALRALGFIGERRIITRFYEARKGAHSATVDLTPADNAEVSYRANTAQQMDRAGIFPANPSGYNCSTCAVKSRCPIMASKS